MTVGLSKSWMFRFFLRNFRLLRPHYYTVIPYAVSRRLFSDPKMCDLERPLDMIQGVCSGFGADASASTSLPCLAYINVPLLTTYISVVLNVLNE